MKNILIAFVCALFASPVLAQPNREEQATMTTEQVTVTGNITATETGWAAAYQPPGTLIVQTGGTISRSRYELPPGSVFDEQGRPVNYRVQPNAPIRVVYADVNGVPTVDHVVVLSP
ncbi:MAG: hypothetical protein ACREIW_08820 [Chthoniobacterales bacterium]